VANLLHQSDARQPCRPDPAMKDATLSVYRLSLMKATIIKTEAVILKKKLIKSYASRSNH